MANHIHVPRKFARRHARGISFNSTGKAINENGDSSMSRPFIKPLVYDKATLEAEKEQERIRKERERNMQSEPVIMNPPGYLVGGAHMGGESDGASMMLQAGSFSNTNNHRPATKQVTFRADGGKTAMRYGPQSDAELAASKQNEMMALQSMRQNEQAQSGQLIVQLSNGQLPPQDFSNHQ